jgi:hypothetical protein
MEFKNLHLLQQPIGGLQVVEQVVVLFPVQEVLKLVVSGVEETLVTLIALDQMLLMVVVAAAVDQVVVQITPIMVTVVAVWSSFVI